MIEIEECNSSDDDFFDDDDRFLISKLIDKGVDYLKENADGRSPKNIAKSIGNPRMIKLFANDLNIGFSNIYFYLLLTIFAVGITAISAYNGTEPKWWYFLIAFFICRGINKFLMYLYVNKRRI